MGAKQELVNHMMANSNNVDNCNADNQIQKSNTRYFKHGYVMFRKFGKHQNIRFFVWIWIEGETKIILKESGIMTMQSLNSSNVTSKTHNLFLD